MTKQTLFLRLFLVLVCVARLEASKLSRGVRGSSSRKQLNRKSVDQNDWLPRGLQLEIDARKKDVVPTDDQDNEEDNATPAPVDKNNKDKNDAVEVGDQNEDEPVISAAMETEQPEEEAATEPPTVKEEHGGKNDEGEDQGTAEEQADVATEAPTEGDTEAIEGGDVSGAEAAPTDSPEASETISPNDDVDDSVTEKIYSITLLPFSIQIEADQVVTEDPGMEEFLYEQLSSWGGLYTLQEVKLQLTASPVDGRRRLSVQVLDYTGSATFVAPPVYKESQVLELQKEILMREKEISSLIAESLGRDPATFAVSSIVVGDESGGIEDSAMDANENDLSETGMSILIVAACVGGVTITIIVAVALTSPKPHKPYDGGRATASTSRSLPATDKETAPKEEANIDLNKTFETEDADEVHDKFAENIEKHSFGDSWKNKGPVNIQASVGRGSYHEVSSSANSSVAQSEENSTSPEQVEEELGKQLSELQASVKAAREKTQKLLDESNTAS